MAKDQKARYWVGVCWVDSMVETWESQLGDLVQLPYAYCLHDQDLDTAGDQRKPHIHLILCWGNTTTYKAALKVFNRLSADGKVCCNSIQEVIGMRNQYEYLIHNTDAARAAGKHQYLPEERICGNGFDIGLLEQFSLADKDVALREMIDLIKEKKIINMMDFYDLLCSEEKNVIYLELLKGYSSLLQKMIDGNYQRLVRCNFFKDKEVRDYGESKAGSDPESDLSGGR